LEFLNPYVKTLNAGFVRVLERFEKLLKLKIPFSRTWNVLEKNGFSNGYGNVLGFLGKF